MVRRRSGRSGSWKKYHHPKWSLTLCNKHCERTNERTSLNRLEMKRYATAVAAFTAHQHLNTHHIHIHTRTYLPKLTPRTKDTYTSNQAKKKVIWKSTRAYLCACEHVCVWVYHMWTFKSWNRFLLSFRSNEMLCSCQKESFALLLLLSSLSFSHTADGGTFQSIFLFAAFYHTKPNRTEARKKSGIQRFIDEFFKCQSAIYFVCWWCELWNVHKLHRASVLVFRDLFFSSFLDLRCVQVRVCILVSVLLCLAETRKKSRHRLTNCQHGNFLVCFLLFNKDSYHHRCSHTPSLINDVSNSVANIHSPNDIQVVGVSFCCCCCLSFNPSARMLSFSLAGKTFRKV